MDSLLLCEVCRHAGPSHNGAGCSKCSCRHTLQDVVEFGLEAAHDEIRNLWQSTGARNNGEAST